MAKLYPSLENINRLKVQPTEGERHLINNLIKKFPNDVEIYYQPFINGDRPDLIIMKKGVGVTIIEVKDWNLSSYKIDSKNQWSLQKDDQLIKSPFRQIQAYKDNLFNLHISGLLEKKIRDNQFYGRIRTFVYFHKATKKDIETFYNKALQPLSDYEQKCHMNVKKGIMKYEDCNNELNEIKKEKEKIRKSFSYDSVGNDELDKINLPREFPNLFTDEIYNEFQRYLQPPYHVLTQGLKIKYTDQQTEIINNEAKKQKIKGVAGSGKTTLLAKLAVNEYKKVKERVLILSYNITLKSYIHDNISDVREGFSWKAFYIDNYHDFFKRNANNIGIDMSISSEIKHKEKLFDHKALSCYIDKKFYSNPKSLEKYINLIDRYSVILIDEIQDYKPEWIEIIEKYFLKDNGKMILFGDEKQNIYKSELDADKQIKTIKGFGHWKTLTKPTRNLAGGDRVLDLAKNFQSAFFRNKYELDDYKNYISQLRLNKGIFTTFNHNNPLMIHGEKLLQGTDAAIDKITTVIFKEMKAKNIQPNDAVILSTKIAVLREIDYSLRKKFKSKTITTFETKEMFEMLNGTDKAHEINNIRHNKKLSFTLNSGLLKLSTIHSFKGYEAPTVFLVLGNEEYLLANDKTDDSDPDCVHHAYKEKYHEIIYTGITRSKTNLMILLDKNDRFYDFFSIVMGEYENQENEKSILENIDDAINNQLSIDIEYKQHDKVVSYKSVKPYRVLFMNDNYYIPCEVDKKYIFSMFRLQNIISVKLNDERFELDMDLNDFIANIQTPFARYQKNYRDYLIDVIVEVDSSKAHFFENKQFLPSQKKLSRQENGNLILSFQVTQEREIEDLIKRWLPYLKVIEPISLDEKIKIDIKQYLNS